MKLKKFILPLVIACVASSCVQKHVIAIGEKPACAPSVARHIKSVHKFATGEAETLPKITDSDLVDFCECVELLDAGYSKSDSSQ